MIQYSIDNEHTMVVYCKTIEIRAVKTGVFLTGLFVNLIDF